jgi:hypothetical protein
MERHGTLTTKSVVPKAERPAVRANGTVNPSESPMVASDITRGLILQRKDPFSFSSSLSLKPLVTPESME